MVGTLASRVTGLLRASVLAQFFPPGVADAFVTAFKVPNLFRELLAEGALTNSFVPVYRSLGEEERKRLSGSLLGLLLIASGVLMLLAYLAAPWLANILIGDPDNVDVELTTRLIRIVFPFLPAISLSALAMGILNSHERFLAPAWAPVMLNVVTVTLMALFPGHAVMLTVAHVLGGVAQLLVQIPALVRHGLLPRFRSLWHPAVGSVLVLMVPFAFTTSGRQLLNVLANNTVTSLFEGAALAFQNADLFLSMALGLFSISPALAYYSRLSAQAVDAPERFAPTLSEGLRLITFLTIPAGLALTVLVQPLVEIAFNWRSLAGAPLAPSVYAGTVAALAPLGLAVFPVGLFNLLVRTFYIRRETRIPVVVVLLTLTLQGALYLLLSRTMGIAGLSWAAAIAGWFQLLLTTYLVRRRVAFDLTGLLRTAVRVGLAAGVAAFAAGAALGLLPLEAAGWFGHLAELVAAAALFVVVFAFLVLLLRVPEAHAFARRLLRRR